MVFYDEIMYTSSYAKLADELALAMGVHAPQNSIICLEPVPMQSPLDLDFTNVLKIYTININS